MHSKPLPSSLHQGDKMRVLLGLSSAFLITIVFQACGKPFASKFGSSRTKLFAVALFAPEMGDEVLPVPSDPTSPDTVELDPEQAPSPTPSPYDYASTPTPTPKPDTPYTQEVDAVCTKDGAAHIGGTVASAAPVHTYIVDGAGQVACTINDPEIRATLLKERKLVIKDFSARCPGLTQGIYSLQLNSPSSSNLLSREERHPSVTSFMASNCNKIAPWAPERICFAWYNFNVASAVPYRVKVTRDPYGRASLESYEPHPPAVLMDYEGDESKCHVSASPLIVQIFKGDPRPRQIQLSAPAAGVRFDILGRNSRPAPYAKKLISWFTRETAAGNYFITLPDAHGEVRGIDQLFGDNTLGPDGKFAANGYEALRKWDGRLEGGRIDRARADGIISRTDPVFSRLRFWSDSSGDGKASLTELYRAEELGIEFISLDYDRHYSETDRFGNSIKMKSTVRTIDGLDHVMYDIWFRITN